VLIYTWRRLTHDTPYQKLRDELDFQKVWINTCGDFCSFINSTNLRIYFFFCAIIQRLISALWPNETGKRSLSKVVQRVRNYLQLDFQKVWINTCEDFRSFINGTNLRIYFFFCAIIQRLISALWPNETGKRSLSKVVQRVRNYLQLDF